MQEQSNGRIYTRHKEKYNGNIEVPPNGSVLIKIMLLETSYPYSCKLTIAPKANTPSTETQTQLPSPNQTREKQTKTFQRRFQKNARIKTL